MNNVCGLAMHFPAHTPTEASCTAQRKDAPYMGRFTNLTFNQQAMNGLTRAIAAR
jgi:hypothetical protein